MRGDWGVASATMTNPGYALEATPALYLTPSPLLQHQRFDSSLVVRPQANCSTVISVTVVKCGELSYFSVGITARRGIRIQPQFPAAFRQFR